MPGFGEVNEKKRNHVQQSFHFGKGSSYMCVYAQHTFASAPDPDNGDAVGRRMASSGCVRLVLQEMEETSLGTLAVQSTYSVIPA